MVVYYIIIEVLLIVDIYFVSIRIINRNVGIQYDHDIAFILTLASFSVCSKQQNC